MNSQRLLRGILTIVIYLMIINLIAWHAKPHFAWFVGGVVTYLVIFNVKYTIIDHKTYSLSSVVDATNLIVTSALTTFIALTVSWLLVILGTRAYHLRSRQAANITMKFILTMLTILAIPIIIHYVINSATVTWALPNFLISFLGLLFLIQTLMVAAIGLILTGFSALIGLFAQAK